MTTAARMAMMTTTIKTSISVKPALRLEFTRLPLETRYATPLVERSRAVAHCYNIGHDFAGRLAVANGTASPGRQIATIGTSAVAGRPHDPLHRPMVVSGAGRTNGPLFLRRQSVAQSPLGRQKRQTAD